MSIFGIIHSSSPESEDYIRLKNKVTEIESALSSRIDNIIVHNNDTEGNTELIDIRTGADGTVYTSAGAAVREQINKIESDYNDLSQAVQQFAYTKSFDDYCKTVENKTIANVNGSYRIVDSVTDNVVCIAVAEIFSDGKTLMFGSTNYSNNTFLFLDENMNILGFSNRSSLSKSFFASLEYASDCVWAAVAYPKNVVPDITAVSRENFTATLNILPSEKGTNLLNGEFSHGYFSPSDVSWNASYRSTNIFEIPIGATISFNSAIKNSRYLILLDENLDYYDRKSIVQNISGQCLYTNQSGAKLFGYITSSIELYPTQTPDIAVVGTYSIDELNGMSAHELNDHLPQSLMPYDLSFALVSQNMAKTGYHGKTFSGLGDSLTAKGSGGIYLNLIKNALKLEKYKNCGNGGTRVSGNYETAFWQDSRVEQLDINSTVITIMGGTNDAPFITVSDSDFTFDNCDTNNFVGAYNVLLSKIFYKFLKRTSGYYPTVDYSNLAQADTVDENFRVILITPPQRFDTLEKNLAVSTTGEYVKRIGRMWGIPVIDAYGEMQMNCMTYTEGREDQVHFDGNFHKKLAEVIIGKLRLLNPI